MWLLCVDLRPSARGKDVWSGSAALCDPAGGVVISWPSVLLRAFRDPAFGVCFFE